MRDYSGLIIRVIYTAIVLAVIAFLTPGFRVHGGIGTYVMAAIIIGILNFVFARFIETKDNRVEKGARGFLITALTLYLMGKLVSGVQVTIIGALIGAFVLGLIETFMPYPYQKRK